MASNLRRNGQQSSCEPCRKSKLRCDHARPHCARCIRRGLAASQCYYHPAPMSQKKIFSKPDSRPQPRTPVQPTNHLMSPATTISYQEKDLAHTTDDHDKDLDGATGIVGMHSTLMSFAGESAGQQLRVQPFLTRAGVATPPDILEAMPSLIGEGVSILEQYFELQTNAERLTKRKPHEISAALVNGPIAHVAFDATLHALQGLWQDRSPDRLREMSRAIFEVSIQPLVFPANPANGALVESLCTPTARWDTIGFYFASLGLYLGNKSFNSSASGTPAIQLELSAFALRAYNASMQCYNFGERLGQVNDLTLWHVLSAFTLATWCFGDDSYRSFHNMGTLSSVFLALNLHRDGSKTNSSLPEYAQELRKRAIARAHEHDKTQATFVNRPPRLSSRFCAIELPLDLLDEDLLGTPENFQIAKAALDENGWNRTGAVRQTLRERANLLSYCHREEVLELSFGPSVPDLEQRVARILSQIEDTWRSIPYVEISSSEDHTDALAFPSFAQRVWRQLEYLYNKFLCYKLLVKHADEYRTKLIETSHKILNLILTAMRSRVWSVTFRIDSEWVMALYAMPCATVLLLELSRRMRQPHRKEVISNSIIIKELSGLLLCCDWLAEKGQCNYQIIKQAQSIFSRGIDQVIDFLSSPDERTTDRHQPQHTAPRSPLMPIEPDVAGTHAQNPEWTTWLETLDFDADLWYSYANDYPMDFSMNYTPDHLGSAATA